MYDIVLLRYLWHLFEIKVVKDVNRISKNLLNMWEKFGDQRKGLMMLSGDWVKIKV